MDTFKFPFQVPSSHDVTQNNGERSNLSRITRRTLRTGNVLQIEDGARGFIGAGQSE